MNRITLILGGARSGKSSHAEQLAGRAKKRIYIATAEAIDDEMRERIAEHRHRRGSDWLTCEAPLDLVEAITAADERNGFVLVDCITVWLANLMHHECDIHAEADRLYRTLEALKGRVVIVANEVGLGIVPDNALARRFRDEAGRINQKIAAIASEVIFMSAGIPLVLKKRSRARSRKPRAGSRPARKA
jgi:adenosylcobinamide kinase / adenosylcobinamide-phosphate guanylyltransferase